MHIRSIDFIIVVAYLAGITLFGVHFRRGQTNLRDYFLAGRSAPWLAIACSIVATETSTLTIIGTPALAFTGNLGFLQLVMGYLIARVILCVILIPHYFQGEFYTAYQFLGKRFGPRINSATALVFLATRALAEGVRIAAIGKVVSVAFGTGERLSILIVTLLTLIYTYEGGMSAVIWTDVIQLILYLTGSAAAFILLLHKIPGHWATVTQTAALAGGKLRIFDFTFSLTQTYTFWSGVLGGTFLTMASHGTDQTLVQRLLAARSERDSKIALLASGGIVFFQFTLFLLVGVMLFVYAQKTGAMPRVADADRIFPQFIVSQMPRGLAGLVLASIFAVAMSNASGSLNSLATSTIVDFRPQDNVASPNAVANSATNPLRRPRILTVAWAVVLGSLGLVRWGPVLEAGLTIASLTYGAMLGVFLLAIWNRRATQSDAMLGLFAGLVSMILVKAFTPLAWTWYFVAGTIVCFSAGSLASLFQHSGRMSSRSQAP
jgi:solute:Na+ symporter, SSS family